MSCYKTGGCGIYEMRSCNECPASKPEYLTRDRLKETNEHRIRHIWTARELAEALITHRSEADWDYDYDEEPYICGYYDVYTTSDGEEFCDLDEAIDYEVWWLGQEVSDVQ